VRKNSAQHFFRAGLSGEKRILRHNWGESRGQTAKGHVGCAASAEKGPECKAGDVRRKATVESVRQVASLALSGVDLVGRYCRIQPGAPSPAHTSEATGRYSTPRGGGDF